MALTKIPASFIDTSSGITGDTTVTGNFTVTGYLAGPSTFTIDPAGVGDNTGTVVIAGNLQVDGTTTTINSTTMTVDDLNITLASGAADAAAANGAGITVDGASASLTYYSTPDAWSFNKNVGIGTSSPQSFTKLQVNTATDRNAAFFDNAAGATLCGITDAGASTSLRLAGFPLLFTGNGGSGAEHMRIDSAGNVGIGTDSPASTLHVDSSAGAVVRLTRLGTNAGAYGQLEHDGTLLTITSTGDTKFYNNADESMRIDSSNRVLIGKSSAAGYSTEGIELRGGSDNYVTITKSAGTPLFLNRTTLQGPMQEFYYGVVKVGEIGNYFDDLYIGRDDTAIIFDSGSNTIIPFDLGGAGARKDNHINFGTSSYRFRDLHLAGEAYIGTAALAALESTIADTAVDVFVYDTRKDSDGGAWRKRTQHTSWYNESSSATRGSRKEFPCVAVIVAESDQVTIYDGDDPSLPMWMVFNQQSSNRPLISSVSGLPSSLAALNGIIALGLKAGSINDGQAGIGVINFISELVTKTNTATSNGGTHYGPLIDRNTGKNSDNVFPYGTGIAGNTVNDVAMTVLPNAPIDPATGLPVPTIAVATNGGVSVIKDDGNVFDITNSQDGSTFNYIDNLFFRKDGALVWVGDSLANVAAERFVQVLHNLPTGDINQFTVENSSAIDEQYGPSNKTGSEIRWATTAGVSATSDAGENFAVGTSGALHLIKYNREVEQEGAIAHITSDYNTGYMLGDIKLGTLSDTDTTNVTGTELVTNGTFDTGDFTGWTISGDTTPTISSGGALLTTGASVDGTIEQSITGSSSDINVISWTVTSNSAGNFGLTINGGLVTTFTSTGSYTYSGAISSLKINHRVGGSGIVDNISVRLAEKDRSYNNNGLQVFGTVTKSAVATGADLVAYSGFSQNNYLEQPYNTDMDVGTGSFSIMGWINYSSVSTFNYLLERQPGKLELYISPSDILVAYFGGAQINNPSVLPKNVWNHICVTRSSSGIATMFINGNQVTTGSTPGNINVTDGSGIVLGSRGNGNGFYPFENGSMSLWRISKTVPSAEQVKKIYEDEKFLFQAGAQATLYGSSDAVTALAYDENTGLLHVGTSAGRSDFQGLRRINNTTNAVGTAISASNGMIVEE